MTDKDLQQRMQQFHTGDLVIIHEGFREKPGNVQRWLV